jgi:hypothetical protein
MPLPQAAERKITNYSFLKLPVGSRITAHYVPTEGPNSGTDYVIDFIVPEKFCTSLLVSVERSSKSEGERELFVPTPPHALYSRMVKRLGDHGPFVKVDELSAEFREIFDECIMKERGTVLERNGRLVDIFG